MSAKMLAPFGGYVIADGGTAVGDVFRARRTTGPNGDLVSEEFTINGNPVSPQEYRAAFDAGRPAQSLTNPSSGRLSS